MTADEWLAKHGKHPERYAIGGCAVWLWYVNGPPEVTLPAEVRERLSDSDGTFPTHDAAVTAFRAAFDKAVAGGWNPEAAPDDRR
jgi:hypothetical protein